MSFPWYSFSRLFWASAVGVVGVMCMAWVDSWLGTYAHPLDPEPLTTAQVLHLYAWEQGADFTVIGYFFYVGWRHHTHGTKLMQWSETEGKLLAETTAALLMIPVLVLVMLHYTFGVDWQFWPADLCVALVPSLLGYLVGRWANRHWGKKSATT